MADEVDSEWSPMRLFRPKRTRVRALAVARVDADTNDELVALVLIVGWRVMMAQRCRRRSMVQRPSSA